jgi:hypothetical protein
MDSRPQVPPTHLTCKTEEEKLGWMQDTQKMIAVHERRAKAQA